MKKFVRETYKRVLSVVLSASMVMSTALVNVPLTAHAAEAETVKIENSEIASAEAKTVGPASDGDDIWASFDGDTATYTNSNYFDPAAGKPQVYTITFKEAVKLNKVRIHPRAVGTSIGNGAPDVCTVEVSADGSTYTTVVSDAAVTDTALVWTDIAFDAVSAKAVKLTMNSKHESVVATGEVEFYKEVSETTDPGTDPDVNAREALQAAYDQAKTEKKADYAADAYRALGTTSGLTAAAEAVLKNQESPDDLMLALANVLNAVMANKPEQTVEAYKEQVSSLWAMVGKYYVKGQYRPSADSNMAVYEKKVTEFLANAAATTYDGSWRIADITGQLRSMANGKLSAVGQEIYRMVEEQRADDSAKYQADSWTAYADACTKAWTAINSNKTEAELAAEKQAILDAKNALVMIDTKLVELRQLAAEKSEVAYADYTRESWRAFKNAIWQITELGLNNVEAVTEEQYQTLKANLENAYAGLTAGTEGTEYGVNLNDPIGNPVDVWAKKETNWNVKGGQLYVSNEVVNGDGTTTLTVTWINDGMDPEYGGLMHNVDAMSGNPMFGRDEWSTREFSKSDWENVLWLQAITVTDEGQKTLRWDNTSDAPQEDIGALAGFPEEMRAGFTKEITVPTGAVVTLQLAGFDNAQTPAQTYSLGAYHTVKKDIKEDLRKALADYSGFEPEYLEQATWIGYYNKAVADAEALLANPAATEADVAKAVANLTNRYWFVTLQESVYHYSYTRENFDYNEYLTDSAVPLFTAYKKSVNISASATSPADTEKMKLLCKDFEDAVAGPVKDTGEANVMVGISADAADAYARKYQGEFTVSSEIVTAADGEKSLLLHVRFENTGVNPFTGEIKTKYPSNDMNKLSINLQYCPKEIGNWTASVPVAAYLSPIDGAAYKGYEGTLNVDEILDEAFREEGDYPGYFMLTAGPLSNRVATLGCYRSEFYANPTKYTVTVENGTGSGRYLYNAPVTAVAEAAPENQEFAGWEVNGVIVSLKETYTFYASANMTVTAVYKDAAEEVTQTTEAFITNVITTPAAAGKYDIKYVVQLTVPAGQTIKEAGLVWSNKGAAYNDETLLDLKNFGTDAGVKVTQISKISNTYQYSVTIKGVPETVGCVPGRAFVKTAGADGKTVQSVIELGYTK